MKKLLVAGALITSICLSVFAGYYISNQNHLKNRKIASQTLISFAIGRIEDLKIKYNTDTMEVLISNIYASVKFTDDGELSAALHDLWNALIFDGENIVGKEDDLIQALQSANPSVIKEIAYNIRMVRNNSNLN